MKRLTVLRHAKSSWDQAGLDDFDRPLNDRGREAARRIGRNMATRSLRFDLCLASPAVRVRETLAEIGRERGDLPLPIFEDGIYHAGLEDLLGLMQKIDDSAESVLLVGHNPGVHELVVELTSRDAGGLRDRVLMKFPTAAMAELELPAAKWRELTAGSGTVTRLTLPRELD